MFWIQLVFVLVPPICLYKYINRGGDGESGGLGLSIGVLFVQAFLVLFGGAICTTIAVMLFAFGLFLGYGAWYMPRVEKKVVFASGENIRFDYMDAGGERTKRRVLVTSCDNTYIHGICSERNAARTFRRDRILGDVTIESTGEIINPEALAYPSRAIINH